MDYFATSQFYDQTCNNEQLRMQARFTSQQKPDWSQLTQMTGVEYSLLESHPPRLFIIVKRLRSSPKQAVITAVYYVLEGTIFMAPTVNQIVASRTAASAHWMHKAMEYLQSAVRLDELSGTYILKDDQVVVPLECLSETEAKERVIKERTERAFLRTIDPILSKIMQ